MKTLFEAKRIYFVGIKGIAMSALAVVAKEHGLSVSGSDLDEEFPSDQILRASGIPVEHGFDGNHILAYKPDVVVYTGAHNGRENVEVKTARQLRIPVYPHGQALGMVMKGMFQVSVAGSHGKTTTASMIATVFTHAKKDPSYAIGCGEIRGLGNPGHKGKSRYFIAEADEYVTDPKHDATPRFLWQNPDILVVTNIDFDHPDAYDNIADVQKAFVRLQQQVGKKITIINNDDSNSSVLLGPETSNQVITYGTKPSSTYRIHTVNNRSDMTTFRLSTKGQEIGIFTLHVPGMHNVYNATATIIAALSEGIPYEVIREGLMLFGGAKRRFELIREARGVHFYDDYAHHPKEITATLKAIRGWYPKDRIISIFQPHTYSRTKSLFGEFSHAFSDADCVCITEIYASARENDTLGITGEMLSREISRFHPNVHFAPTPQDVFRYILRECKPNDRVIFMGAGNIYIWAQDAVKQYSTI